MFDKEGIPAEIVALDSTRANVVARLKGNGRKRPLLIMGHTDVVTVTTKWTHPPSAATRVGGQVKYATVQMMEKRGRGIELVARGIAGHGSVPLASNAIVHLAGGRLTRIELELRAVAVGRPAAGRWR